MLPTGPSQRMILVIWNFSHTLPLALTQRKTPPNHSRWVQSRGDLQESYMPQQSSYGEYLTPYYTAKWSPCTTLLQTVCVVTGLPALQGRGCAEPCKVLPDDFTPLESMFCSASVWVSTVSQLRPSSEGS
jgi:hypothetical protein